MKINCPTLWLVFFFLIQFFLQFGEKKKKRIIFVITIFKLICSNCLRIGILVMFLLFPFTLVLNFFKWKHLFDFFQKPIKVSFCPSDSMTDPAQDSRDSNVTPSTIQFKKYGIFNGIYLPTSDAHLNPYLFHCGDGKIPSFCNSGTSLL